MTDDEPLTAAGLRKLGFFGVEPILSIRIYGNEKYLSIDVSDFSARIFAHKRLGEGTNQVWRLERVWRPEPPPRPLRTVGDVRRLCAALGAPLEGE